MRTIQMTINDDLLESIDKVVKERNTTRSAFAREALKKALERYSEMKLEEQHCEGYRQKPVKENEFDIWQDEQVWVD